MAELRKFLSLLILLVILLVVAAIGYVVYMIVMDISSQTKMKMEKKNINFSRDGMKVGVKHISAEQVSDSTQG
jgi:flagellar basal body-associated protein FliL